uniref:Calcium binding protein 39-like n=1 Tax=Neolamprologus brichardi TaxID=32507 RepID=A0A3Q4GHQ1_NEOBR
MPLFGKSHKSPADIVKTLKENLAILVKQDKKTDKASEEVSKCLVSMKEILYGSNDKEPHTETVAQLAQELYNSGLLIALVENLQVIDFEGKKDVCQIFNNILRRQIGTRSPTVEYFCSHQEVLFILLKGYEMPQVALNCGIMLRECIRHEPLAKIVLHSEHFHNFFNYVEMSTFDIASDAFATFKVTLFLLLLAVRSGARLEPDWTLTSRLLLHFRFPFFLPHDIRYVPINYKVLYNLIFDSKVFVANPNKTQPIIDILLKNQTKLIDFLSNFQKDRTDDEQFNDEKTYLIKQIRDLKKPAS